MKKVSIFVTALTATLLLAFKPINTNSWSVDSTHSRIGFTVTHLGIANLSGSFNTYEVKVTGSKEDFSDAVVEMSGEASSINTANEGRDKHLKSPDFFDAEKFPKFTFKSTAFKKSGKDEFNISGQLTLHGVTKDVTLKAKHIGNATNPVSKKIMSGFKIVGTFKRTDFGIGASIPAMLVSDVVTLDADLELAKD